MPPIKDVIDRMNVTEKLQTLEYLWSSLSLTDSDQIPAWHADELRATEARVAADLERPIPWDAAKALLGQLA